MIHVLLSKPLVLLVLHVVLHALLLNRICLRFQLRALTLDVGERLPHHVYLLAELCVLSLRLVESEPLLIHSMRVGVDFDA